jgi:hypothetical protein
VPSLDGGREEAEDAHLVLPRWDEPREAAQTDKGMERDLDPTKTELFTHTTRVGARFPA